MTTIRLYVREAFYAAIVLSSVASFTYAMNIVADIVNSIVR